MQSQNPTAEYLPSQTSSSFPERMRTVKTLKRYTSLQVAGNRIAL
jgi:hypothetical protein